jgi:hypothetical protein
MGGAFLWRLEQSIALTRAVKDASNVRQRSVSGLLAPAIVMHASRSTSLPSPRARAASSESGSLARTTHLPLRSAVRRPCLSTQPQPVSPRAAGGWGKNFAATALAAHARPSTSRGRVASRRASLRSGGRSPNRRQTVRSARTAASCASPPIDQCLRPGRNGRTNLKRRTRGRRGPYVTMARSTSNPESHAIEPRIGGFPRRPNGLRLQGHSLAPWPACPREKTCRVTTYSCIAT